MRLLISYWTTGREGYPDEMGFPVIYGKPGLPGLIENPYFRLDHRERRDNQVTLVRWVSLVRMVNPVFLEILARKEKTVASVQEVKEKSLL